jgi:hypothetical protein
MPAQPDRFLRHGPVRVRPGDTHLTHADGTPFFYLADTAWNGALLSTEADWATYLDDRAAKGFTAIQFITHAPWTAAKTNLEGQTAFTGHRPRTINPEFFDRIDQRIEMINARGLLAVPVLAWAANFGPSRKLNIGYTALPRELIPFIAFQVDRFARHHLLWILAGDGVYNFWRARKWKRVARALFGNQPDPNRAPVALHPAGHTWPYDLFKDEPWLDLYGYQSSHSEHPKTLRWLQSGPPAQAWKTHPKPTINLEPVYEGIGTAEGGQPQTREAVRRAAWWSCMNAPTAGVAYGAHGLWGWHTKPMEALNHHGLGIGQPWQIAMNFPGSQDMAHLATFFTSIPWHALMPAQDLLATQPTATNPLHHVAAARTRTGDLAVAYLPNGGQLNLNLSSLKEIGKTQWFNPRTGEYQQAAPTAAPDHFTAPTSEDWVWLAMARDGRGSTHDRSGVI